MGSECSAFRVVWKDKELKRAHDREIHRTRRDAWFQVNGPCVDCGTWENLQLDHVDPATKITHRVWSWSTARREVELAKCVARCQPCHFLKTIGRKENPRGETIGTSKLTAEDIRAIRASTVKPYRLIAERYNVDASLVGYIKRKVIWKHIDLLAGIGRVDYRDRLEPG